MVTPGGESPPSRAPVDRHEVEPGRGIVAASLWATAAFTLVSLLAAVVPEVVPVSVGLDFLLFVGGCGAFMWAYAMAIGRSRRDQINLGGLTFLADGVAPRRVAARLRGSLAVQVVVAVVAATIRPFSSLAFGVLAPMFGLGLMTLWGARHGWFPARDLGERPASDTPHGPRGASD